MLAGCGKGEGNSQTSQSSTSINYKKPTSISSTPNSKAYMSILESIKMVNAMTGWATAEGFIFRTVDGGVSWTDITPKGIAGHITGHIFSRDGQTAWIAFIKESSSKIIVYNTADGGQIWKSAEINTTPNQGASVTFSFVDTIHGWLLAGYGTAMGSEYVDLFHSIDGGVSWKRIASANPSQEMSSRLPFSGVKTGLVFSDQKNGWLTGFTHGDGIWLHTTTDEGLTWTPKNLATPSGFHTEGGSVSTEPPHFFGSEVGLMPVEFRGQTPPALVFYTTQDGGANWKTTTPVQSSQESYRGFQWSIIDAHHSIVSDDYKLYYTSDGSYSFESITPNIDLMNLQQLDFVSEQLGWAIIDGGLWKTNDGGHIWTELSWTK